MSMVIDAYRFGGGGGGGDPFFAYRKTVANLDSDLADPFRTWTAQGGAVVSGGWLNLDGSGDYLTTPNSSDFDFGSGDFCVEGFVEITAAPGSIMVLAAKWQAGATAWLLGINPAAKVVLAVDVAGSTHFPTSTNLVPTGVQVHIAAYRAGDIFYVAVDGTPKSALSVSGAVATTNQQACIGASSDGSSGLFAGKVRGVRITKGSTGGYGLTSFTPPTFPLPTS